MRSPFRLRTDSDNKVIRFGEMGRLLIEFTGDLPFERRGAYTGTLYVWTERKRKHWVDKRDLPKLVKEAGRDNLEGLPKEEKPKKSKKFTPPEPESVAQGGLGEGVKDASI